MFKISIIYHIIVSCRLYEVVVMVDKKQDKISVSFSKEKELEQNLYKWLLKKGELIGVSTAIKQILYEKFQQEQEGI